MIIIKKLKYFKKYLFLQKYDQPIDDKNKIKIPIDLLRDENESSNVSDATIDPITIIRYEITNLFLKIFLV